MRYSYLVLPILLVVLFITPGSAWLTGYTARQEWTIGGEGWASDQPDYEMSFTVYQGSGTSSEDVIYLDDQCQDDFDDIEFTLSDDTLLDSFLESKTDGNVATITVEIPIDKDTGATGYIYYRNASSVASWDDGWDVFDWFEGFGGSSVNSTAWTVTGTPDVASGLCKFLTEEYMYTKTAVFADNHGIRARLNVSIYDSTAMTIWIGGQAVSDSNRGSMAMYDSASGRVYLNLNSGGSSTAAITGAPSAGTFFTQEIQRIGELNGIIGANAVTVANNYYTNAENIRLGVSGGAGNTMYVDFIGITDRESDAPYVSTWEDPEINYPDPNFSANVTSGAAPLDVVFTYTGTYGTPTNYYWDIEADGDWDSISASPTYTFYGGLVPGYTVSYPDEVDTGTFNVSLKIIDAFGYTAWENKTAYITVNPPDDWFSTPTMSANVTTGAAPLTVVFSGIGNNTPTAYAWDVDGDSVSPYSDAGDFEYATQNATHTYNADGIYTVRFKVTNDAGYAVATETNYITVGTAPTAAFNANDTTPTVNQTVTFTDSSTHNPASWQWSWGDGTANSTSQNPTHAYSAIGNYTVTLTATNAIGSDTETKVNYITVSAAPTPTPTPTPTSPSGYARRSAPVTTIPTVSTSRYNELLNAFGGSENETTADIDVDALAGAIVAPYTDLMGIAALVILVASPFILMWIGQEKSSNVPLIVGILVVGGFSVFGWIPADYWMPVMCFITISVVGLVWLIMRDR